MHVCPSVQKRFGDVVVSIHFPRVVVKSARGVQLPKGSGVDFQRPADRMCGLWTRRNAK